MKNKYLSMKEASKVCSYEQEYLSLLARRGELQAEKKGRNWYTTVEWLNEYIEKKKPNAELIHVDSPREKEKINRKEISLFRAIWIWLAIAIIIIVVVFFVFQKFSSRINAIEERSDQFIPEEIIKIPDEQGNFDVYSKGTMKIGKENVEHE